MNARVGVVTEFHEGDELCWTRIPADKWRKGSVFLNFSLPALLLLFCAIQKWNLVSQANKPGKTVYKTTTRGIHKADDGPSVPED